MTDVCLILEGTYPYVAGGVSSWIHQLITAMSDLRFSILHISAVPNLRRDYKYVVPANVVDIRDLYLQDLDLKVPFTSARRRRESFAAVARGHEGLFRKDWESLRVLLAPFRDTRGALTSRDVFKSLESWDLLVEFYGRYGEGISFVDFFWTWRSIYVPVFKVLTAPLPKARLYHTVSTGYAGLAAAIAKISSGRSMLLTEHGIYTHERLLEISQSTWIRSPQLDPFRIQRRLPYFKRLWFGLFQLLSGAAYHYSDHIVTLYEGNKTRQIIDGADPKKISLIPNGVDLDLYHGIALKGRDQDHPVVVFVGRIVPIKDVKTFIQACSIILEEVPNAEFLAVGPIDEEPEYAAECRELALKLGLDQRLRFTGPMDLKECYNRADVVVLTSLSEAQPLVALEAAAVGVPVVATDVGACRELLEGRAPEDRALGSSGIVTQVSHPEETAAAVIRLIKDKGLWRRCSEAGRRRVMRFYDQNDLLGQYLNLYERHLN